MFRRLVDAGRCRAVMPMQRWDGALSGLTTPYTCAHWPVLADSADPAFMEAAGSALGRFCRTFPTVRIDAIPAEWPGLAPFQAGLRRAGLFVQRFDHFGNWHEPVAGLSWSAYLAARPGELRTTVGRKLKRAERDARLEIVRGGPALEPAIAAFEHVYEASWKEPEPFPRFNPALMRALADEGALRLGVLWAGARPAAVQFWAVAEGCATVLKLAHDEAFKPLSPGTVLTAMMIRSLLDGERVGALDFGRGDDPYKASWTTQRRSRIGLLLMNPRRPRGLLALARSLAGRAAMTQPLLLHVFPTFGVGGAQVRFAALANRFGASWRHAIVSLDGAVECAARLSPALDVRFPAFTAPKGDLVANLRAIRRLLRTLRPDVLVTSNWGSIEWALANGLPSPSRTKPRHIHTEDGFGPEERTRQLPRRVWTRRIALRRSAVVLPSRTLLRIATDQWRLNPANLHYIPNGIDLGRFAAAGAGSPNWPGAGPVIGTVAALRPEKNAARLLRAFHLADQPGRVVIIGDGGERPALEALSGQLGLTGRVHFAGYMADPAPLYATFDIFALSSDTEQMPLSVLEAMAAGLPVAATDVGDVRTMVSAENAPFITPVTDEGLADGLRRLLADPAARQRAGAANRLKATQDFEQEAMFQAYAALINDSTLALADATG